MFTKQEKWYIENGFVVNAVQKFWDRQTGNGQNPDACTLLQAKGVINDYMLEIGYERHQLRK